MNKLRIKRISIGIFGPSALGTLFMVAWLFWERVINDNMYFHLKEAFPVLVFYYVASVIFMGIQSIAYAMIMEFIISKRTNNLYIFIGVSGLLGFLAGMSLILIDFQPELLSVIGLLTGLILGWILYFLREGLDGGA